MSEIIGETFELPSQGKLYGISGQIELSSMTAEQELRRLSHSDTPYKTMCNIIQECIQNDVPISPYDMCIGDYQYLLYKLRVVTYGPDYKIATKCPFCGNTNHDTISLDDLPVKDYDEDIIKKYSEFILPKTKSAIKLQLATPRMLDDATLQAREHKKRSKSNLDYSGLYTIGSMIDTIDHQEADPIKLIDWLRNLPMADMQVLVAYTEKLNSCIGIDIDLTNTCELCGFEYDTKFQPDAEFFRPTIDIL